MSLKNYRKKIDLLDAKIVEMINDRAAISHAIGKTKQKQNSNIYSPAREKEVLERIKKLNKGPMPYEVFEAVYREVMSGSLLLENFPPVAFFGSEGSFTYMAAQKKFGEQTNYTPCASIWDVFQKVEQGECGYGVVPIENSTEGAVTHTFDLLVDSDLKICAQVLLKISHNLMVKGKLKSISKVYSHIQVLAQCRGWLLKHYPLAKTVIMASSTEAAKRVVKEKNAAAIASSGAAKINGLTILNKNIQDVSHNTTRFLVISKQDVPQTGHDRTSILFSIKDKVGALHDMLAPFHKNNINLTKIESRPSKKRAWDYYFFVDFEGHIADKKVIKALDQLENMCKFLKVLGSYPV